MANVLKTRGSEVLIDSVTNAQVVTLAAEAWLSKDFSVTATLANTEYPLFGAGGLVTAIDATITAATIHRVEVQNLYANTTVNLLCTTGAPGKALAQNDSDHIDGASAWNAIVKCDAAGKAISVRVYYKP